MDPRLGEAGDLAVSEACDVKNRTVQRTEWRCPTGLAILSTVLLAGPNWVRPGGRGPAFQTRAYVLGEGEGETFWAEQEREYTSYADALAWHVRILSVLEVDEEYPYRPRVLANHLGAAIRCAE